ncbi:ankyrin repeat domain-containing protein [Brevibacillus sp. HB2.2]|uniref:ankyrin repeat domain-containing protein n=1 Tax=Brevibacillus sp. HB2.2 TaxID=2738846 RepID=UPI00156BBA53|nr:ankyrin repeat domain-containing protein [Brevibacillus sp. HB2.2]NRS49914.1 ankyrin repeat domain-containing protein [Brevibacillus sp. HB2.2]
MSIKLKRSLLLGLVVVICLSIWVIVLQSMTGSKSLSSNSNAQDQKTAADKAPNLKKESHPNLDVRNQDGTPSLRKAKDEVSNQVAKSGKDKSNQPEVSMNLDYDQIIRLTKGDKIVAIADDQLASEEARQARQEIADSWSRFDALTFNVSALDNKIDKVKLYLKAGMDPNAYIEGEVGRKSRPIHAAASNGHLEMAKLLLEHGANPNHLEGKYSVITLAIDNYDMLVELLKYGAEPDLNYQNYRSPLMHAVQDDRVDIAKLLLDHGANPNLSTPYHPDYPNTFMTPLEEARRRADPEMIALLEAYVRN